MSGGPRNGGGLGPGAVDTSGIETQFTEIPYGTVSSNQTLNIYLPNAGVGPFPVIVAIHGGGFMMGSATGGDVAAMLEGVNYGYAVVSINYRLSGEAAFPAAVSDCKAAIRFIKANAEAYNLDADRIAVWGDSAGGNLAAMVGTTSNVNSLNDDNLENLQYSSAVQAVVDWFGPLDFLAMDAQFEASGITPAMGATSSAMSLESQYIGQLITEDPELTQQANPRMYIETMTETTTPNFLIEHGTADANVPVQQSIDFATALESSISADKVTLVLLEGARHGTSEFTAQENLDRVFAFLDGILK
ncbi:MAG: alpha/beta hydrolase [Anaerolineae bacterium]|nr:alpha/beta hydrolase [Anaerolineae bacterium]